MSFCGVFLNGSLLQHKAYLMLVFLISRFHQKQGTGRPAHRPLGSGSGHVIRLFTALCQCTHDRASPMLTKCVTQPAATIQCVLEKRPRRFSWDRVHKHTGVHTCSHAPNSPRYTPFSTKHVQSERVQITSPIHGCKLTFKGL